MGQFITEHLSAWGGMACLSMFLYTNSFWYAIGFIVLFLLNTFYALYKHAQFVVYTQTARDQFHKKLTEPEKRSE